MKKINIRRLYYHARRKYFTLNNGVIIIAFAIAAGFVWGALGVMQRNYDLQKDLDLKQRQLQLVQLQTQNLQLGSNYYQTSEYQQLAVRQNLGLALPGESVLILPPNSQAANDEDNAVQALPKTPDISNFSQWMNFLFGTDNKDASS